MALPPFLLQAHFFHFEIIHWVEERLSIQAGDFYACIPPDGAALIRPTGLQSTLNSALVALAPKG
ncbi:hypothetical protein YA29_21605 [Klebsiella aerogenes]|nr:hypothetical protein YA29_21605 [Klebsiella aerogenes]KLF73439.1 hypothetical protein YA40_13165 [Klebsiella aerogenes]